MPRKMTEIPVANVSGNDFAAAITGAVSGQLTFKPLGGEEAFTAPRSTNVMLFGEQASGKSYQIVQLLLHGYKVYVLMTDYAGSGLDTVYNYFHEHTDTKHLLKNFRVIDLTQFPSEDGTAWKAMEQFVRNPVTADPQIYEFDPDILFWDGGSSFQQSDLEDYLGSLDPIRRERGSSGVSEQRAEGLMLEQSDWGMVKNGTLKPLIRFLKLHNPRSGKRWSKVVTLLEDEKAKYENNRKVEGTEKVGPMLHGAAREIAGAGFSIALRSTRKSFGLSGVEYQLENSGANVMIKDRGFNLPSPVKADLGDIWDKYIAPKIGTAKTVLVEKALTKEAPTKD